MSLFFIFIFFQQGNKYIPVPVRQLIKFLNLLINNLYIFIIESGLPWCFGMYLPLLVSCLHAVLTDSSVLVDELHAVIRIPISSVLKAVGFLSEQKLLLLSCFTFVSLTMSVTIIYMLMSIDHTLKKLNITIYNVNATYNDASKHSS